MDTFPRVSIYPHKYIYMHIFSIHIYISKKLKVGHGGGVTIYIIIRLQVIDSEMTIVEMTFM